MEKEEPITEDRLWVIRVTGRNETHEGRYG